MHEDRDAIKNLDCTFFFARSQNPFNFNAFHAAGECRRQLKNVSKFVKNIKILEFGHYIWNHCEKCIQISTNMPGIGSLICEIYVKITQI